MFKGESWVERKKDTKGGRGLEEVRRWEGGEKGERRAGEEMEMVGGRKRRRGKQKVCKRRRGTVVGRDMEEKERGREKEI